MQTILVLTHERIATVSVAIYRLCSTSYSLSQRAKARGNAARRRRLSEIDREVFMQAIHAGQCGLCTHFGESHHSDKALVSIMTTKQADLGMLDECGHPKHASLHLKVTPISGCDGFIPAASA